MPLKKPDIDQKKLQKKIAERLAFLKKAREFVENICHERGVGSEHDRMWFRLELRDFGGFTFQTEVPLGGSNNIDGRKSVRVWFHPKTAFSAIPDQNALLVMNFNYKHDIESCEIVKFEKDERWQQDFLAVIKRRKTICDTMDAVIRAEQARVREQEERRREEAALVERAKRLHLV